MVSSETREEDRPNSVRNRTLAGGVAGFVSRCIVTPFDVIKIRFQTQVEPLVNISKQQIGTHAPPKYSGLPQAFQTIFKEEGLAGLWRGSIPGLSLWVAYGAIQFPVYSELKKRTAARHDLEHNPLGANNTSLAISRLADGAIASSVATLMTYPLDILRTRYVSQGTLAQQNSLATLVSQTMSAQGLRGLYAGLGVTLLQVGPSMAITFAIYESLTQALSNRGLEAHGSVGFASGFVSKLIVYPLDTVKKRLQVRGLTRPASFGEVKDYRGGLHCVRSILYREGIRGFFKGVVPSVMKTGLATGTTFYVYEWTVKWLDRHAQ